MAAINDLIAQVTDDSLREKLEKEVSKLSKQIKFGLVFESHLPEVTPLFEMPVKQGCKVMLKNRKDDKNIYVVLRIDGQNVECVPINGKDTVSFSFNDLVRVAEFGESIYPYLKPIDYVCNAPDSSLWHTLIEADNYHALQLLEYLYAGKVDCIYIDPPYNTGAKDWKYNNDYVDSNDVYRHSKWLSMMERRLKLAKKLLNPKQSVLICTIDEKEYLHLGCLLEEVFNDAKIQMVTTVINPKGSVRAGLFTRCDEYIFFVFVGEGAAVTCDSDYLFESTKEKVRWPSLKRTGTNSRRASYKSNAFYPIFYDKVTGKYAGIGESIESDVPRESVPVPEGMVAVWPIDNKGEERIWQLYPDSFIELSKLGYIDYGTLKNGTASPYYVSSGLRKQIEDGEIIITGRNADGVVQLEYASGAKKESPKTTWNKTSHSASEHGTNLLMKIFGEKRFQYPKSVYAVKDTLKAIVGNNKDALIVDFFAGSGTTLNAVNLLNAEDDGKRRCIMITNNEVSDDEARALREKGFRPGDAEWDNLGIARHVTWPRTKCCIKGKDIDGNPLKGTYLETELEMSAGFKTNAAFFKLGFLDKTAVALGMQLKELLPVLWMKAGAIGKCPEMESKDIPSMLILPDNSFAVLIDENSFAEFEIQVKNNPDIQTVYIVTDYEVNYRSMVRDLNVKETYQLYRDYLDNFRINHGRD